MKLFDTIVAPITGAPPAAVALVRLSGPDAFQIARGLFPSLPHTPESHRAYYGPFISGDDGLVFTFAAGRSYTGDESAELSVHGSRASVAALVKGAQQRGARLAEPGEFTLRAFLNGRLDLSQAEAVRDTVFAQTEAQLQQANRQRQGGLRDRVSNLRSGCLRVLGAVEASVDFSEEIGEFDRSAGLAELGRLRLELERLLLTADSGRILRNGYRIALIGPPNVGKSSLLNALLRSDRAIVTPIPGTTRDFLEEAADLGGVPCVLIDTAGLREAQDEVERIGISRSREVAADADAVWLVVESGAALPEPLPYHDLLVRNKADLHPAEGAISAETGEGLEMLIEWVRSHAHLSGNDILIDTRHELPLRRASEALQLGESTIVSGLPDDLLSVALREAIAALGEVTGETASEDMVARIFRDFCIGK